MLKLLSEDPSYEGLDAPSEAIRRILQIVTGKAVARGPRMETSLIGSSPALCCCCLLVGVRSDSPCWSS